MDMCHIVVIKAAEHMEYGIGLTYVGEEFISKTFPLACALHKSCDIHDLYCGRNYRTRIAHLHKLVETVVGHGDNAHIGLYGAEREVG